jgi:hypothetical protein
VQVAAGLQLRPEQVEQLGAAYEIYNSKRHQLCSELQQCSERLQPLLGPHHSNSSSAAAAAGQEAAAGLKLDSGDRAESPSPSSAARTPESASVDDLDAGLAAAAAVAKLGIAGSPSGSFGSGDGATYGTSSNSTGSAHAAASAAGQDQQMDWLLDFDSAEAASILLQRMEHLTDAISVIKLYMRNAYVNCLDKVQLARACVHSWPYIMNVWVLCAVALGLHDEEDGLQQQHG